MSVMLGDLKLALRSAAKLSFWFGAVLTLALQTITFVPGTAEIEFAAVVSAFCLPGLLLGRRYPIATVVLLAILSLFAYDGYKSGQAYRQRVHDREFPPSRKIERGTCREPSGTYADRRPGRTQLHKRPGRLAGPTYKQATSQYQIALQLRRQRGQMIDQRLVGIRRGADDGLR